jgi:hypothetical protein
MMMPASASSRRFQIHGAWTDSPPRRGALLRRRYNATTGLAYGSNKRAVIVPEVITTTWSTWWTNCILTGPSPWPSST